MAEEQWSRLKKAFQGAIERAPGDRAAFLAEACGDDLDLRREVEHLIASHGEAGTFLESPATPDAAPMVGRRVGAYRVLAEIGRGGMGRVYRAVRDDDSFQRHVAVKIVHGGFDSDAAPARFRRERQILARLQHPNIATLHDGGTTEEGQPYLVMELVEGEPLDAYCASRRLGVRERLALFRTMCGAVHYAHQNLVVHRDLKPGNILVTPDGVPKLLDFGISKLISPDTELQELPTATLLPRLTPEYASPEQVRGEPVTTAGDIYSLGVVLYEMLAGKRPYEIPTRSPEDVLRVVCGVEPEKPSTAARRMASADTTALEHVPPAALEGDLDTIVLKCLRKEPSRRYASARELSDDLTNHLEGRPVTARPDSAAYRASKFVRRHKLSVVSTAAAVLALLGITLVALAQAREARLARARAEKRFQDVRKLAHSVIFELHDRIQGLPGSTSVRELLVTRALEYLDDLAAENPEDPVLKAELAKAYEKIGDVQGGIAYQNLGHREQAFASYRRALVLREQLAARFPRDPDHQHGLTDIHARFGMLSSWGGDGVQAVKSYGLMLQAARSELRLRPGHPQSRFSVARGLTNLGQAECFAGDVERGLADAREGIALFAALAEEDPPELRRAGRNPDDDLAIARQMLGESLLAATDRVPDALVALNDSLAVREARLRAAPDDPVEKSKAALLMGLLGDAQVRLDALADAGRSYDRGASLCQDLLARDPDDEESRFLLATLLEGRAEVDLKAGRAREAETRLRSILADVRARLTSSPDDTRLRRLEVVAEHAMGQVFDGRKGGRAEACAHHLRALVGWTLVYGKQTLAKADAKQADEIRAAAEGCRSPVRASADSPSGG